MKIATNKAEWKSQIENREFKKRNTKKRNKEKNKKYIRMKKAR